MEERIELNLKKLQEAREERHNFEKKLELFHIRLDDALGVGNSNGLAGKIHQDASIMIDKELSKFTKGLEERMQYCEEVSGSAKSNLVQMQYKFDAWSNIQADLQTQLKRYEGKVDGRFEDIMRINAKEHEMHLEKFNQAVKEMTKYDVLIKDHKDDIIHRL